MFRLRFKLIEKRPVGVVRDKWREICRKAWFLVGEHWFRNMLKNHFNVASKHKYNHRTRSTQYRKNKVKAAVRGKAILGGVVDNVFTGRMMHDITSTAVIRGFPTRVRVSMFGPNYMRMRFKAGSNQPNKKQEIITTTQDEQRILKRIMREYVTQQIKAIRDKKVTNI
jgi:hypothetical protein